MKVHQAFLRGKTDCQSIGRINIKPSSKGYANDSDVFCTFGKAMKRRRVAVCQALRYIWGQWGFVPHLHLLLAAGIGINPLSYADDMGLSPLDLKNSPPGLYVQ